MMEPVPASELAAGRMIPRARMGHIAVVPST